jgi:YidC/Oxa1 family membrane protein insertase
MDQKRLFLAIAVSLAILLGFQWLVVPHLPKPAPVARVAESQLPGATPQEGSPAAPAGNGAVIPSAANAAVPKTVPRLKIDAPRIQGSISLLGARLDDLVLKDYREQIAPTSPLVRLLEPRSDDHPYYIQYGWTAPPGVTLKLPDNDTVWAASARL